MSQRSPNGPRFIYSLLSPCCNVTCTIVIQVFPPTSPVSWVYVPHAPLHRDSLPNLPIAHSQCPLQAKRITVYVPYNTTLSPEYAPKCPPPPLTPPGSTSSIPLCSVCAPSVPGARVDCSTALRSCDLPSRAYAVPSVSLFPNVLRVPFRVPSCKACVGYRDRAFYMCPFFVRDRIACLLVRSDVCSVP